MNIKENDYGNMMRFPEHKCGLYLQHNEHRNYCQTAEEWIEEYDHYKWKDEASRRAAIKSDSVWTLQWYPDTPIGFYAVAAPTLDELLEFANSVNGEKAE